MGYFARERHRVTIQGYVRITMEKEYERGKPSKQLPKICQYLKKQESRMAYGTANSYIHQLNFRMQLEVISHLINSIQINLYQN